MAAKILKVINKTALKLHTQPIFRADSSYRNHHYLHTTKIRKDALSIYSVKVNYQKKDICRLLKPTPDRFCYVNLHIYFVQSL